jgi:hypothetical protein
MSVFGARLVLDSVWGGGHVAYEATLPALIRLTLLLLADADLVTMLMLLFHPHLYRPKDCESAIAKHTRFVGLSAAEG